MAVVVAVDRLRVTVVMVDWVVVLVALRVVVGPRLMVSATRERGVLGLRATLRLRFIRSAMATCSWPAIVGAGYLASIFLAYFLRWRDARSAQRSQQTLSGYRPPSKPPAQRSEGTGGR
jgi:hypothetical protein